MVNEALLDESPVDDKHISDSCSNRKQTVSQIRCLYGFIQYMHMLDEFFFSRLQYTNKMDKLIYYIKGHQKWQCQFEFFELQQLQAVEYVP